MKRRAPWLVVLSSASVLAQPPTTRVQECVSCHGKQMQHTFLHGPAAVQACDACHQYKDPATHSFELKRQGKDLCAFCHIDKTGTEGPVVHAPVANGECSACHDPHGANNRRLLKKDTTPALCADCHKDVLKGAHAHAPATTDCLSCHKAHTADHERLLTAERRDLCVSCHQDVGKAASGSKHPHDPAKGDCLQCHAPHASEHLKVLRAAPADLCVSCHKDVGNAVSAAKHPHSAATGLRACLNCHTPHGSDHARQLTQDTVGTCLACHNKPIKVDKERTVPAVLELANTNLRRHGPIGQDDCSACHGVHGSEHPHLLERPYADGFYQKFADEAYALCFKCHDKSLALAPTAEKETSFRDGTRNLHYLHVAASPQGRSCRSCHTVHASRFEAQIADSVMFGQWKLPINFTPSENGGSCSPGCHKTQAYSRSAPIMPAIMGPPPPTPPASKPPASP